jgi:hypothetical protein
LISFFLLGLGFWLLTTGTGFNWAKGLWKRGGGDERVVAMTRKLGWWLWFMFEAELVWGHGEVHPSLYKGMGGVRKD